MKNMPPLRFLSCKFYGFPQDAVVFNLSMKGTIPDRAFGRVAFLTRLCGAVW